MIGAEAGPAGGAAATRSGPVVALVGPTAAGKTALSLGLAHALAGEVINADAMQLYRGMDIGTAKLTHAEREGVPHHAFDLWEVTETASVAAYQRSARAAIDDVLARGRTPLLVGGSGLYVRAVLEQFEFPGTDPEVRARLEAELAEVGTLPLYERLAALDPAAAAKILPGNGRRIVRALEVIELTGAPFLAALPEPRPHYHSVHIGVDLDTAVLDERIAARVDMMWERGLVAEVRQLVGRGLREGRTASRALGYQQVLGLLDGELDEPRARAETVRATRRFVRRQRSWFRRDPQVHWLDGAAGDLLEQALELAALPTGGRLGPAGGGGLGPAGGGGLGPAGGGCPDPAGRSPLSAHASG